MSLSYVGFGVRNVAGVLYWLCAVVVLCAVWWRRWTWGDRGFSVYWPGLRIGLCAVREPYELVSAVVWLLAQADTAPVGEQRRPR